MCNFEHSVCYSGKPIEVADQLQDPPTPFNISPKPDVTAGKLNNQSNMFSESKNKWIANLGDESFT